MMAEEVHGTVQGGNGERMEVRVAIEISYENQSLMLQYTHNLTTPNSAGNTARRLTTPHCHWRTCAMATSKHTTSTPRPKYDLSGQAFHQLIAQRYLGQSRWECLCVCGKTTRVQTAHLTNGHTRSCGCLKRTQGIANTYGVIHRLSFHPIYRRWRGMLNRCYNPHYEHFAFYGGRGITV